MDLEEKKLLKRLARARDSGKLDEWELCCRRLAELRVSYGHYDQALQAYQEELAVCEAKADPAGTANAHRMVGEMYNTLGQFAESLDHVNKYLAYARQSKNAVEEQRALATIGRTYFCWAAELKTSDDSPEDRVKASEVLKECRKAYMKSLYICEQELKNVGSREKQEMKARILFNLGLACEIEEELPTALSYVAKSIVICKQESLLEDLHRCYISQATMLLKQSETHAALVSVDQACEVAKRLTNTTEFTVLALLHKSEIYFAMNNYVGAKKVLKKGYKLRSPNEEDRKAVETSLKRAIILCELEAKLTGTDETSLSERKDLNEKLGDACCSVKSYKHALQCYLNMLDCALALGQCGKQLQPCYVSLYTTYRDDKQYDLALEYARKELEVVGSVPSEAAKSHIAIGEILELKGSSYFDISEEYLAAHRLAVESGNTALQASALRRLLSAQQADGRLDLASETEKDLAALGNIESEDSESDEDPSTSGVHFSDISDSEEENGRTRPSRNTFRVTRNEKGETPLHVAAIRGDVPRAQRLLSLGHPVKERDLAGWTPLHEAANHGHVEMVRALLKAGADANDPGGRDCGGVTPLHDAASCGHFDVISVLLEHKALVTVLTDAGETPLDCLKAWRKRVDDLSDEDEVLYEQLIQSLESKLSAAGFQRPKAKTTVKKEKRSGFEMYKPRKAQLNLRRDVEESDSRKSGWGSVSPERHRRSTSPPISVTQPHDVLLDDGLSSPHSEMRSPPLQSPPPVADYRATMDALRKRPVTEERPKHRSEGALLDESSYVEEWLEDDMRANRVQKKKRKVIDFVDRSGIRSRQNSNDVTGEFFFPLDDPADFPPPSDEQSRKKAKLQSTLLDAGFSAVPAPLELQEIPSVRTDTSMDYPSLPSPPFSSVSDHMMTKVRINVGRLLLLVPVDGGRSEELTVRWLAEEAARRYCDLEGAEPQLQLRTRDGAILAATDPVSVAMGEDLDTTVLGWKTSSLTERYLPC